MSARNVVGKVAEMFRSFNLETEQDRESRNSDV